MVPLGLLLIVCYVSIYRGTRDEVYITSLRRHLLVRNSKRYFFSDEPGTIIDKSDGPRPRYDFHPFLAMLV